MRWPWRDRFEGVIIATVTGEVTALPFIRFREQHQALRWAYDANDRLRSDCVRYDYRPLPAGPGRDTP